MKSLIQAIAVAAVLSAPALTFAQSTQADTQGGFQTAVAQPVSGHIHRIAFHESSHGPRSDSHAPTTTQMRK
jgi:hypothetical protein